MILTFASSKGGVGKSTTCAAIASALALDGARVLLIDLDQNRTLDRWARKAPIDGLTVSAIEPQKFGAFFRDQEASGEFDHICIDLPGSREVTLFKALARSDLVVIPAQASEPDLREALVVVSDIRDVGETTGRAIPYRLLLTKVYPAAHARHRLRLCRAGEAGVCRCSEPRSSSARPTARCSSTASRRPSRNRGRGQGWKCRTCSPRSAASSRRTHDILRRQADHENRPQAIPADRSRSSLTTRLERLARDKGVGKFEKPPAVENGAGEGAPTMQRALALISAAEPEAKAPPGEDRQPRAARLRLDRAQDPRRPQQTSLSTSS